MDNRKGIVPVSEMPLAKIQVESKSDVLEGIVRENETYILSKTDNYESDTGLDEESSNANVQTTGASFEPAG